MAGIIRKTQQIFANDLPAAGNIAVFGSLADGSPAYSKDPATIQNTDWLSGFAAALIQAPNGLASPTLEDFNAVLYVITRQLAYILENGMPEWDAGTIYNTGAQCRVAGVNYMSLVDNNQDHLVTDTNFWVPYGDTLNNKRGIAKAWVTFDGRSGTIRDSFNVSGVNRTAAGCYFINFQVPIANALYAWSGSVGVAPGEAFSGGDDNYLTGGAPGKASSKTANGFSVFCYDRVDTSTQDSSCITVIVFGA